ncbi:MAG: hypothetical protein L0207_03195 [Chlamydiae bacterium]|nr:hypothetical protein [Chlamydiota bacterium]
MRLKRFLLIGLCFSTLLTAGQDDYSFNDHLSLLGDWLYLRRSKVDNVKLVEDSNKSCSDQPNCTVMNADNLLHDMDWEQAVRGSLTYTHSDGASLEALYIYVWPWIGEKQVTSNGGLSFPFKDANFAQDFMNANLAKGKYTSAFQNGELNYWRHLSPRRVNYFSASWVGGFRFIYLRETLDLTFQKNGNSSEYDIKTKNLLYGIQFGGIFEINPTRKWTWTLLIKAAAFLNDMKNEVFLGDLNNTAILRDFSKKSWQISFLGEASITLSYQLFSHLNIHLGYQGLLLNKLALAPEQKNSRPNSKKKINKEGNIAIDGAFAGATLSY